MALFLDAGYVVALEASDDQHHAAAMQLWRTVRASAPRLVTTTYVFDEIVTFLNSRGRHDKAVLAGERLLGSAVIELVHIDELLFREGWRFFTQHRDKRYSLTDCLSFVVMQQRGIREALTFDHHFRQAGFETLPG